MDIQTFASLTWSNDLTHEELLLNRARALSGLAATHDLAALRQNEHRVAAKEYFDQTHPLRAEALKVGDLVVVYDETKQRRTDKKLHLRWSGPFVVHEKFENGSFRLRERDGLVSKRTVSGSRLKRFIGRC